MLSSQQRRQLGEQVHLELAGDSLTHVLAELPAAHTPLDSRREILRHRNADFTSCSGLLDFQSHITADDVRPTPLPATVGESQPLKQSASWTLLGGLEDNQSFNSTPCIAVQRARSEERAKFSWLTCVERAE